ncbi:MAG: DUF2357 domain-containing protein, partial [Tannerellaceae bacterium]|nr:DUF2357 domain-containing protein [Tannerellaceae bacterium]
MSSSIPSPLRVPINIKGGEKIHLFIHEDTNGTLFHVDDIEANENGESPYQLVEGKSYEYELDKGYSLETSKIVTRSKIKSDSHKGRIITNIYVGSLSINVFKKEEAEPVGKVVLEIRSVKTDYRTDYRIMLEEITVKTAELLMQHSELVNQQFTLDPNCSPRTLYQNFAFIRSIVCTEEFADALHRIHTSPIKRWKEAEVTRSISNIRRINHRTAKQLATKNNRSPLPCGHPMGDCLNSLPHKVTVPHKEETVDIPENRFVKYVLQVFLQTCFTIANHKATISNPRLKKEALLVCEKLEQYLSFSLFKDISNLTILPLNSPVLQRQEGYREVLQTWLMFAMASRLGWSGGDHIYEAGKKDVATLYEYWLFFKLLELMEEVFQIAPVSYNQLIVESPSGLELSLQQGKILALEGVYINPNRNLRVEFSYNRTFSSSQHYLQGGTWTKQMRPDYTLSIWPDGIDKKDAEKEELIVHIHFDAKYKIDLYKELFQDDIDPDEEKEEQRKGQYKRADLLKMHAYKDAIRRTVGAYVLYPGDKKQVFSNYHELLPGLGAFAISPSKSKKGTEGLKDFLNAVVGQLLNRASQWEKISYHVYDALKEPNTMVVKEKLPEPYGKNRDLVPDETFVLIGFYKNKAHKDWITDNFLYNTRTDNNPGSLPLNEQTTKARYLLLHGHGETKASLLYKLDKEGPKIYSKELLLEKGYPEPSLPFYIVYK